MRSLPWGGSREFSGAGALAGSTQGVPELVASACCLGPRGLASVGAWAR
jgi:hypothetical protein